MNNDRLQFRAWIEVPLEDDAGNKKTYGFYLYYVNVHDEGKAISFNDEILADIVRDLPISDYEQSQIISYLNLHNDIVSDTFYIYKNPKYIEQCTGIKDENDKWIYEGDIISDEDLTDIYEGIVGIAEVRWNDESAEYGLYMVYGDYLTFDNVGSYVEIIGNVHENPELLEGKEGEL